MLVLYNGTLYLYLCINIKDGHKKQNDMNTDNTLAFISSMISSEASYKTLVDMINEMDLELMDVCMA